MKFNGSVLVVSDIAKSRKFYETVLRQKMVLDFIENIIFEGDFVLRSKASFIKYIGKDEVMSASHNFELCFEEENFMEFIAHLSSFPDIEYIHTAMEYPWGQRVVRFYDPDKHIIEVSENIKSVISRFVSQGFSNEEAAKHLPHSSDFMSTYPNKQLS